MASAIQGLKMLTGNDPQFTTAEETQDLAVIKEKFKL
jgi:hypothetical protein